MQSILKISMQHLNCVTAIHKLDTNHLCKLDFRIYFIPKQMKNKCWLIIFYPFFIFFYFVSTHLFERNSAELQLNLNSFIFFVNVSFIFF